MRDESMGAAAPDDSWDDEDDGPSGHPLIATIVGTVLILLSVRGGHEAPAGGTDLLAYMFGRVVGGAALIWALAYFITIRHAGIGWKVGSFLIFLLASAIAAFAAVGQDYRSVREDMRLISEIQFLENGDVEMPGDPAKRGPVARLVIDYLDGVNADARAMEAKLVATGVGKLADPDALKRDPAVLSDCGKIAEAKTTVAATLASGKARTAALGARIDTLDAPADVRDGLRQGILRAESNAALERQYKLLDDLIDSQRAICTVLARRHWQPSQGKFLFTSRADLEAFQMHSGHVVVLSGEAQQIRAEQLEQVRRAQRQMQSALR